MVALCGKFNPRWAVQWLVWAIGLLPLAVYGQASTTTLVGLVRDAAGLPLGGVQVEVHETHQLALTDLSGIFRLPDVRPGSYHLHFQMVGYRAQALDVAVKPGAAPDTLRIALQSSDIELSEVLVEANPVKVQQLQYSLSIDAVDVVFLRKQVGNNLMSALAALPGVNVMNVGVGIAKPVLRGLSFNRVVVVENGIKQEGQQWGGDHGLEIDQFNVERVQVLKGPSSLFYGSDAIGGVIQISAPPPPPDSSSLQVAVYGTYRSINHTLGQSVAVGGRRGSLVLRARFSTQDYADYRVPASQFQYNRYILPILNGTLKNTAGRERNAALSLGLIRPWGFSHLHVTWFDQHAGLFAGAMGIPRAYQLTDDGNRWNIDLPSMRTQHLKIISNTNIQLGNKWLQLDVGYQHNLRTEYAQPHAHGYAPVYNGQDALRLDLQTLAVNAQLHHRLLGRLDGVLGLNLQAQQNRRAGFEFLLPDFRTAAAGLFLHQQWTHPTQTLTLNGGVRLDWGYTDIVGYAEPLYDATLQIVAYRERNPGIVRRFSNVSAAVGASWYPAPAWNLKLNLATDFRFPTPQELSMNGIHHGTFRHEKGDANLLPERGYQLDLTGRFQRSDFTAALTPFAGWFNNYIYLRPGNTYSDLPDGGQLYQYEQVDALFTGLEAHADYHFWRNLHAGLTADFVWAYNFRTLLPLPMIPPSRLGAELEYTLPSLGRHLHDVYLSLQYQYTFAQNRTDRNEWLTPGFGLLNLGAGFGLTLGRVQVQVYVQLRNLLDTYYLAHLSRYRQLNLPEPGRNLVLGFFVPIEAGR